MKKLTVFLILIIVLSCNSHIQENELDISPINNYFNQTERKELANIISYVDSIILINNRYKDIDKAYHYYLDSIYQNTATSSTVDLAFDQEQKYDFIFNIDSNLFNKIWWINTPFLVRTRDTILHNPENYIYININHNGTYVEMIKEIKNNRAYYKSLYEGIKSTGMLNPNQISGFLYYNHDFDFNNINNRLWASVFLLTIEESVEKKVESYLTK